MSNDQKKIVSASTAEPLGAELDDSFNQPAISSTPVTSSGTLP